MSLLSPQNLAQGLVGVGAPRTSRSLYAKSSRGWAVCILYGTGWPMAQPPIAQPRALPVAFRDVSLALKGKGLYQEWLREPRQNQEQPKLQAHSSESA
ncbi:Microtubule-Associated Protein 4 [Manis pentadactyla]|nr:Microtubule-Associated Protein 4 [Manis pentadactyla]